MKKLIWLIVLIPILVAACSSNFIILDEGKVLPEDICNKIDYDALVIHETGCPWCTKAIPMLEEIEKESNLKFRYLDIANKDDLNYMLSLGFTTQKIPALLYNCKVYMGAKSKEEYFEILKNG